MVDTTCPNNLIVSRFDDKTQHRRLATDFPEPCADIPTVDNPVVDGNYDGWELLDFCLFLDAAQAGNRPATSPNCHHNDDDSSYLDLPVGFTFDFYGNSFDRVYVNNNGNLSFGTYFSTYTASGFPVNGFPMIAPFWGDVDTGDASNKIGHVWAKQLTPTKLAIAWEEVGHYLTNESKRNTFQVVISDGTDASMQLGNNVCFCYTDMQWTTGDASSGSDGFGGSPATVGANKGDGSTFFQIGRFDNPSTNYDGSGGANDGVSYLNGKSFCFNAAGANNVPPIATGVPPGNALYLQCGDPLDLSFGFIGPELGQTVSVVAQNLPPWITVDATTGDPATVHITGDTNDNEGLWPVELIATDSEGAVTAETIVIEVGSCHNGGIRGDPHILRWNQKSFDFHGECGK